MGNGGCIPHLVGVVCFLVQVSGAGEGKSRDAAVPQGSVVLCCQCYMKVVVKLTMTVLTHDAFIPTQCSAVF